VSVAFLTTEVSSGSNWWALERLVARVLIHCGWQNVKVVGRTGDLGADIISTRVDATGKTRAWVVQVKAVTGGTYVGVAAVQEVLNAQAFYEADECAVATNGDFTGSMTKRKDELNATGFHMHLWNGAFLESLLSRAPDYGISRGSLRDYQKEIADKVVARWHDGQRKSLFIVATGLGKTVIASEIADRFYDLGLKKILVLCHTQDLATQLEQGFWHRIKKSIATRVFFEGEPPLAFDGINVGLYQTLIGYLSGLEADAFDVIIVDEAHHALSPDFRRCLDHFKPKALVGMTATPWRGDNASLSDVFGEAIAKVSLVDGMAKGFLAKVDYRMYCDNVDWDEVSKLSGRTLSIKDLNKRLFLPQRDEAVIKELKSVMLDVKDPRIAIFSPSIEHARRFATLLNMEGIPCQNVSGEPRNVRQKRLMDFARGHIKAITAVDLLNEGIDVPEVNVLIFLRATHSRRIFIQQLGRGLRIAAGKEKVVVMDFVSDIRRLAEVMQMDRDAKKAGEKYHNLYLTNGIVTFEGKKNLGFIDQWLGDVTDLGDSDDDVRLKFPEE